MKNNSTLFPEKCLKFRSLWKFLFLFLFILPGSAFAQGKAPIGEVILSIGKVKAVGADKIERELKRGDAFYVLDTIVVDVASRSQLKFSDGGIINLIASTEYRIDSYIFKNPNQQSTSLCTLLKGGFRAISGAIAQENPSGSSIRTAVATIGLRGTVHEAFLGGDRLAVGCEEGKVAVWNNLGEVEVGPNSKALYATVVRGEAPKLSMEMPPELAAVLPTREISRPQPARERPHPGPEAPTPREGIPPREAVPPGAETVPPGARAYPPRAGEVPPQAFEQAPVGMPVAEEKHIAYVSEGFAYEEAQTSSYLAPTIAIGTLAVVGIVAVATQLSHHKTHHHNNHHHRRHHRHRHAPRYYYSPCPGAHAH